MRCGTVLSMASVQTLSYSFLSETLFQSSNKKHVKTGHILSLTDWLLTVWQI